MQVNIQGVKHDLRQIEQIDSRLNNNEDTQHVMHELGRTTIASQILFLQDGFITLNLKHARMLSSIFGFMNY